MLCGKVKGLGRSCVTDMATPDKYSNGTLWDLYLFVIKCFSHLFLEHFSLCDVLLVMTSQHEFAIVARIPRRHPRSRHRFW
jgi:hypothetical protein